MLKSVKIRLELNNKQVTMARQHAGVSRHAYNWGVDVCQKAFENKEKIPSAITLHKRLVAEVKKENKWYYDSSKCSPQQALRNLETAYKNFHNRQKKSGYKLLKKIKKNGEVKTVLEGLPQYKRKGVRDSFYLEGAIRVDGRKIKVPFFGWLRCSEELPIVQIKNVTISRVADEWFISFRYEAEIKPTIKTKGVVGVDLGIKTLATLSDGIVFPLSERIFKCGVCGLRIDRDLNASLNLEKMAVSSTVSACGVANQTKQCALLPQRSKNKTSNVC